MVLLFWQNCKDNQGFVYSNMASESSCTFSLMWLCQYFVADEVKHFFCLLNNVLVLWRSKLLTHWLHYFSRSILNKNWMHGSLCESVRTLESLHWGCLCLVTMGTLWIPHWDQDSKQETFICYHSRFVFKLQLTNVWISNSEFSLDGIVFSLTLPGL